MEDKCCLCEKISKYGVHGLKNGTAYSLLFCESCFGKKREETLNEDSIHRGSAHQNNQI